MGFLTLELVGQTKQNLGKETRQVEHEKKEAPKEHDKPEYGTLREYLIESHNVQNSGLCFTSQILLDNRDLPTPCAKLYPASLEPWSGFGRKYLSIWDTVFDTRIARAQASKTKVLRPLGLVNPTIYSQDCLTFYLDQSIRQPASQILEHLKRQPSMCAEFDIASGVEVESTFRHLSESVPGMRTLNHYLSSAERTCVCVRQEQPSDTDGNTRQRRSRIRSLAFIEEVALPHFLTRDCLRVGLRSMNLYDEIVNQSIDRTEASFKHRAERASTAAVARLYHYMVESGLAYGLLTTGQVMVFLHIDWQHPDTLYFHLADPDLDMQAHPDQPELYSYLGQYLAFCLTAIGPPGHVRQRGQDERQRVMDRLKTWEVRYERILWPNPLADQKVPTNVPPYKTKEPPSRQQSQPVLPSKQSNGAALNWTTRPYCTQNCLSGLVNEGPLDKACPNVTFHQKYEGQVNHPVDHATWLTMLRNQLKESLDVGITRVSQAGSCGVLFRMTLIEYGYSFVSKGTVATHYSKLQVEVEVYGRLKEHQGTIIPVYLGNIDLRSLNRTYHDDHRVYIVHLILLSFAGEVVCNPKRGPYSNRSRQRWQKSLERSLETLHRNGVVHNGVAGRNVLVNAKTNDIMLIDFEKSKLYTRTSDHADATRLPPKPPGACEDLYAARRLFY